MTTHNKFDYFNKTHFYYFGQGYIFSLKPCKNVNKDNNESKI